MFMNHICVRLRVQVLQCQPESLRGFDSELKSFASHPCSHITCLTITWHLVGGSSGQNYIRRLESWKTRCDSPPYASWDPLTHDQAPGEQIHLTQVLFLFLLLASRFRHLETPRATRDFEISPHKCVIHQGGWTLDTRYIGRRWARWARWVASC